MIEQFLLHLVGDYVTQNHWMATTKTKKGLMGGIACFLHCLNYSVPFILITTDNKVVAIFATHFFIDRFRLAVYWIKLVNWNWKSKNYGYPETTPVWLSTWLLFIIDNIFHLVINYFIIKL